MHLKQEVARHPVWYKSMDVLLLRALDLNQVYIESSKNKKQKKLLVKPLWFVAAREKRLKAAKLATLALHVAIPLQQSTAVLH